MGGFTSKTFKDLLEESVDSSDHQAAAVPETPLDTKRTLPPQFDPRSPSSDISRTPIQVTIPIVHIVVCQGAGASGVLAQITRL